MTGLTLATCDRAFAPDGGAPAWGHLFPEGQTTGRDGRVFDLADPAALVLAFQSGGIDLPADMNTRTTFRKPSCMARCLRPDGSRN